MVVSKDSKRKRKESSPPTTQQQQQQSSTAIESSPEMPKRTKVQAQRKFAQGQSAPQSAYSSIIAASSSSNTGPSTSSESREPPTEILPNKRPKTEDFLTFLCFRGSSALPPHLDFLNQGKNKEPERPIKKPIKTVIKKKGKKGRPPKNAKQKEDDNVVAKEEEHVVNNDTIKTQKARQTNVNSCEEINKEIENVETVAKDDGIPSFPVRKRAEVVADGNRRNNRNADEKCNNPKETSKRRSNRANTKGSKAMTDHISDEEDDEYFSAIDENSKALNSEPEVKDQKVSKTPINSERKSETPSKESDTCKSRKGRPPSNNKKKDVDYSKDNDKDESIKSDIKEKVPVKRPRQKESPIFIPSPEPSGRMTRQRAFFEPVKVTHKEKENVADEVKNDVCIETTDTENKSADIVDSLGKALQVKTEGNEKQFVSKDDIADEEITTKVTQLDVFDFSSDDEQPLAKTIKLKKGNSNKTNFKKTNCRGKKCSPKKEIAETSTEEFKKNIEDDVSKVDSVEKVKKKDENTDIALPEDDVLKSKGKRFSTSVVKGSKKKENDDSINDKDKDSSTHSPKKPANPRQSRKKTKAENNLVEKELEDNQGSPNRNQRPTRKTKEAATIYMGIIGHRLQMAEDDDDDISLSSFDRPNVREMEKMENELKRNSASVGKGSPPPKQSKTNDLVQSAENVGSTATTSETKPTGGRRGRPPKNSKTQPPAPKREIEGMLVKKGVIAKLTQSVENVTDAKESKAEPIKVGTEDDEDFLLNEELNETKRKLEKSFSDSDDEPLAIKAHVKLSEKDGEDSNKSAGVEKCPSPNVISSIIPPTSSGALLTGLSMLPLTSKAPVSTATNQAQPPPTPLSTTNIVNTTNTIATTAAVSGVSTGTIPSPIGCNIQQPAPITPLTQSPFKNIEKKSPVPTSKILNVPAAYGIPPASPTCNISGGINTNFGKSAIYVPQSPAHYHSSHIRPATNLPQFSVQTTKNSTG